MEIETTPDPKRQNRIPDESKIPAPLRSTIPIEGPELQILWNVFASQEVTVRPEFSAAV